MGTGGTGSVTRSKGNWTGSKVPTDLKDSKTKRKVQIFYKSELEVSAVVEGLV